MILDKFDWKMPWAAWEWLWKNAMGSMAEFQTNFLAKALKKTKSGPWGQKTNGFHAIHGLPWGPGPWGRARDPGPSVLAADLSKNPSWEKVMCPMLENCVVSAFSKEWETKGYTIAQILTKYDNKYQIHVGNFQECHFLKINKSNAKRISTNAIFSELKKSTPYKSI